MIPVTRDAPSFPPPAANTLLRTWRAARDHSRLQRAGAGREAQGRLPSGGGGALGGVSAAVPRGLRVAWRRAAGPAAAATSACWCLWMCAALHRSVDRSLSRPVPPPCLSPLARRARLRAYTPMLVCLVIKGLQPTLPLQPHCLLRVLFASRSSTSAVSSGRSRLTRRRPHHPRRHARRCDRGPGPTPACQPTRTKCAVKETPWPLQSLALKRACRSTATFLVPEVDPGPQGDCCRWATEARLVVGEACSSFSVSPAAARSGSRLRAVPGEARNSTVW